ncbi:MAG TPA: PhzF family phenazine biosynthesis protein [Terracidiphilus sp.]|nr:PhzF family phenazine biosynthesis protein [Terracidiphilus sp.]
MSTELEYYIVDVFTHTPLKGNPLAVVMNTAGLTKERMQAIAREFNLSETTFVERTRSDLEAERRDGVRVRIFTTQEELNFAGHPTLGTASVLRLFAPAVADGDTIRLKLNMGTVPVRFEGHGQGDELRGEMTQRDPEFGAELEPAAVAQLCGLSPEDFDSALPPQVVSTGTAFAIVVLRSLDALSRLKVDHEQATPWLRERGARWFYVIAPDPNRNQSPAQQYRARMQFYGGEDPATGSAAGCAISYLVAHNAAGSGEKIAVKQGIEIGRPSDLRLSARKVDGKVSDIRVCGSTVLVAKGHLFLP